MQKVFLYHDKNLKVPLGRYGENGSNTTKRVCLS